ncbi:MAG: transposase [Peptococcales bacterium]
MADRIYRTRENFAWCKERGIWLNGPKLGRPPRDRQVYL